MEQASRSFMTGIRAFSASSAWSSIALAFQVNTVVSYLLDYVEDIYDDDGGPLCPCFNP